MAIGLSQARHSGMTAATDEAGPRSFEYDALPGRVLFGRGAAAYHVKREMERLKVHRIMLIASPDRRELAVQLTIGIQDRIVEVYDGVRPHVPQEVAAAARAAAADAEADALLSVGGGSTTGTAKIVALTSGLPIVAVPTTYAGSEMTPVWGMTTGARKETGHSLAVLPRSVVYDPDLVNTIPIELATSSALNAMAHCVESLWTAAANPVSELAALEGARALTSGLRALSVGRSDEACEGLLYGAYLAGSAFAVAGSGLHHKLCHALGGAFALPHAQTHAVVLPHVLSFNASSLPRQMAALGAALGHGDPVIALTQLYREVGAPSALRDLGLSRAALDEAITIVSQKLPIENPRPISRTGVGNLLMDAYVGLLR